MAETSDSIDDTDRRKRPDINRPGRPTRTFTIRADSWHDWHRSTGPIVTPPGGGDPVMFYNDATADARWRIGWITFDAALARVTGREPILLPPPAKDRTATDIAFAASTLIESDAVALYYSLEDRTLRRAMVRRYA